MMLLSVFLSVAAVLIVAAPFVYRHQVYYHFATVDKGRLYRCGQLSPHGMRRVVKKYKIKTVVNLLPKSPRPEAWLVKQEAFCADNEINHVSIGVSGTPSPNGVDRFIGVCDDERNYPILVHCKQGVYRTGIMVAIYQYHYLRMRNEEILSRMPNFGHNFSSERYKRFRNFILSYPNNNLTSGESDGESKPKTRQCAPR